MEDFKVASCKSLIKLLNNIEAEKFLNSLIKEIEQEGLTDHQDSLIRKVAHKVLLSKE